MQAFFTFLAAIPICCCSSPSGSRSGSGARASRATASAWSPAPSSSARRSSVWASVYGVKLELNNFAKSLFYYLFMYGVGLRVGPSFINSLKGDGLKFTFLAVVSSVLGLALVVHLRETVRAADRRRRRHARRLANHVGGDRLGRAGGHVGRRQAAARHEAGGCVGHDRAVLRHHLYLGHRRHHPDLQIPAALVGRRRQGRGEEVRGRVRRQGSRRRRPHRLPAVRPARLPAGECSTRSARPLPTFRKHNPEYRIVNVVRGGEQLGADPGLVLQKGDVIALGGSIGASDRQDGPDRSGSRRRQGAQHSRWTRPRSSSPTRTSSDGPSKSSASGDSPASCRSPRLERGGVPIPAGLKTEAAADGHRLRRRPQGRGQRARARCGAASRAPTPRPTC